MPKFHQTIFISTINDFNPLDKADILSQLKADATSYYLRGEVTGIMFYGDNYFLNYFECSRADLEQNRQDTIAYPHHHAAQLIYENKIHQKIINTWQMKFTQNEAPVQRFFAKHGWTTFNPYLLKGDLLDEFIAIIMAYADTDIAPAIQPVSIAARSSLPTYAVATIVLLSLALIVFIATGDFK